VGYRDVALKSHNICPFRTRPSLTIYHLISTQQSSSFIVFFTTTSNLQHKPPSKWTRAATRVCSRSRSLLSPPKTNTLPDYPGASDGPKQSTGAASANNAAGSQSMLTLRPSSFASNSQSPDSASVSNQGEIHASKAGTGPQTTHGVSIIPLLTTKTPTDPFSAPSRQARLRSRPRPRIHRPDTPRRLRPIRQHLLSQPRRQ
jgi:hypothetical protein